MKNICLVYFCNDKNYYILLDDWKLGISYIWSIKSYYLTWRTVEHLASISFTGSFFKSDNHWEILQFLFLLLLSNFSIIFHNISRIFRILTFKIVFSLCPPYGFSLLYALLVSLPFRTNAKWMSILLHS